MNFKDKILSVFADRKKRIRAIAVILAAVIAVGGFLGYNFVFKKDADKGGPITAVASVGTVSSVIEGSGTIEALQQYEITSLKKGEVIADFFEEGDVVSEGDVLYQMDNEEGHNVIDNSSDNVDSQRTSVEKSKLSLENAADAIETAEESVEDANRKLQEANEEAGKLNVTAKETGVISELYISKGDNINANGKIADIYNDSQMILEIQFLSDYVSAMTENLSRATVTLSKNGTELGGTVTKIASGSLVNSVGASVTNVQITVQNPGAVKKGDYATAEVNGYACSSEGAFEYGGETALVSEVSGKVEKLNIMVGDQVNAGEIVAVLSNSSLTDSVDAASDSVKSAERNLTSKERSYKEATQNVSDAEKKLVRAQEDYNEAVESLDDYLVKAPITGTIIQKNIKAGENLESSNTSGAMAIIADLSSLVFEMSVDELDISKLKVGMEVEVTADAIENTTFGAAVTNISIVGTSNNGVTSYPVKITINPKEQQKGFAYENYDKLIPGMNVSASVVIEKAENVIVLPVSAVRRGNIVIVSEDSESEGIDISSAIGSAVPDFGARGDRSSASDAAPDNRTMPPSGAINEREAGSDGTRRQREAGSGGEAAMGQEGNLMPKEETMQSGKEDSEKTKSSETNANDKAKERLQNMIDSLDIPEGYKAIVVETGLSDESYIEIKAGLAEGDKVLLPDVTTSTEQSGMSGMMPGGMGGMPGGMGGMPGGMGGMQGGNRSGNMGTNRGGNMGGGGMR